MSRPQHMCFLLKCSAAVNCRCHGLVMHCNITVHLTWHVESYGLHSRPYLPSNIIKPFLLSTAAAAGAEATLATLTATTSARLCSWCASTRHCQPPGAALLATAPSTLACASGTLGCTVTPGSCCCSGASWAVAGRWQQQHRTMNDACGRGSASHCWLAKQEGGGEV
jgi:hypothetical protein